MCIESLRRPSGSATTGVALALTLALAATTARAADIKTFARGSLIIPMTSVFQTQCGQVSAYGLVYRILEANGPGHRNADKPVTVYIINDSGKKSVNRCKPTNTATFKGVNSPNDPAWSDGCDLQVTNTGEQPVVKVDFTQAFPAAGATFKAGKLNTYDDSNAWPRFNAFNTASLTKPNFTQASYGGAPFVIDSADAQRVFDLLKSGDTGTRAFPSIATSTFTKTCSCNGLSKSTTTTFDGLEYSDACHSVDMHQSTISFRAIIERRLNLPPASFALYDPSYGRGTSTHYDKKRFSHAGEGDFDFVLEKYLKISGLWLQGTKNGNDSKGCPVGNVSGCSFNSSTPAAVGTPATEAQANRGVVFDRFTTEDLDYADQTTYPSGILNRKTKTNGPLAYVLFWAPHWEGYINGDGEVGGDDRNGVGSIKKFLAGGGNILGECASVATWEDAAYNRNGVALVGGPGGGSNFLASDGVSFFTLGDEFNSVNKSTGRSISTGQIKQWHSCSDPDRKNQPPCVDFPNQGNIFSQVGDWLFSWGFGALEAAKPTNGYQSWTKPMLRVNATTDWDTTAANGYDVFIMGHEADDKGVVVYVGSHDVSGDVLGARIVLNSMLNLGGVPSTSERGLAAPTIVYAPDGGGYVDQVLTPTYDAVSGRKADPAVANFNSDSMSDRKMWTWPYYPGHLRSHDLDNLADGTQSYTSALLFDSSDLSTPTGIAPLPKDRNLFTWLGGYPKAVGTSTTLAAVRNNQRQTGWTAEVLDGTTLDLTGSCTANSLRCKDVIGFKSRVANTVYDDKESGDLHMVVGSDGLCDVQQVMNYPNLASQAELESACGDSKKRKDAAMAAAWILQRVRGYCDSGDDTILTPTDCKDGNDNRAHLGGLVYSSAAVVGPSQRIVDKKGPRPTVAYVGGYDGQLHAFYVGGGHGYEGPPAGVAFIEDNQPPFQTQYATAFKSDTGLPKPGTELWSFLPASQLPHLWDNTARVDSSPVVLDVFADFNASGLRQWHTVLLVSLGSLSTELLALDVTNPLAPRLLWDTTGSLYENDTGNIGSPKFSPNVLMTAANGAPLPGEKIAQKCVMERVPAGNGFKETCTLERKLYDFQDLGGTAGLSASQIRIGLEPVYVVFAASNMRQGRSGIELLAVEASTGQLMWQWEHPYDSPTDSDRLHDNAVPPVATVITGADGAARVFVGDHEGRLWELDAATGRNLNMASTDGCTPASPCQFPAFDTGSSKNNPQPITTNIAMARIPLDLAPTAALYAYRGERVAIFGTAGADWLSASEQVAGRVHVALLESNRRVPIATGQGLQLDGKTPWTLDSARSVGKTSGVLQEAPDFPVTFAQGERVYGAITVAGSVAYFTTATDKVSDIMQLPDKGTGHTYTLNLGTASTKSLQGTEAAYGGVAVYLKGGELKGVVTSQMSTMSYQTSAQIPAEDANASKKNPSLRVGDNQGLTYRLMAWLRRLLNP